MLFLYDNELKLIEKSANEFSRKLLGPHREENDAYPFGPFFQSILEKSYELDYFHTILPDDHGGMKRGMTALCVLLSTLCSEDSSMGGIIFTHAAAVNLITSAGNMEELQAVSQARNIRDFLLAMPVFCDPSDVGHLPQADRQANGYIISGSLEYLVLGGLAGQALIPAVLSGQNNYSWFLVTLDPAVVSTSPPIVSLGLRACPAVDIEFNQAPATLMGAEGQGDALFTAMADRMHTAAAAMSLGIMKGSFREALDYAKKRKQGGRKIIQWSELQMILGNMAVQIKVSELAVSRSCTAIDCNEDGWRSGSRATGIHVQSLACTVATDGIQILGGVGYMKDFGQEKRFRDAKHIQALLGTCPVKIIRFIEDMI
jgi:alkylation response protein AidB-like acyl-CoA dehydrogenase